MQDICQYDDITKFNDFFKQKESDDYFQKEIIHIEELILKYQPIQIFPRFIKMYNYYGRNNIFIINSTRILSNNFVNTYFYEMLQILRGLADEEDIKLFIDGIDYNHLHLLADHLSNINIRVLNNSCTSLIWNSILKFDKPIFIEYSTLIINYFQILFEKYDKNLDKIKYLLLNKAIPNNEIINIVVTHQANVILDILIEKDLLEDLDLWISTLIKDNEHNKTMSIFFQYFVKRLEIKFTQSHLFLAFKHNRFLSFEILKTVPFKIEYLSFLLSYDRKELYELIDSIDTKFESIILLDCFNVRNYNLFLYLVKNDKVINKYHYSILTEVIHSLNYEIQDQYEEEETFIRHFLDNEEEWNYYFVFFNKDLFDIPSSTLTLLNNYHSKVDEYLKLLIPDLRNIIKEYI